jgi:WD40 repeat protein
VETSPADASSLGFSPDGRLIVVGSSDGMVATFYTASGRLAAGPRVAHPGFVDAATFAPSGRIILSGGTDGTVRLWDAADLRPLGEPLRVSDNAGASPPSARTRQDPRTRRDQPHHHRTPPSAPLPVPAPS